MIKVGKVDGDVLMVGMTYLDAFVVSCAVVFYLVILALRNVLFGLHERDGPVSEGEVVFGCGVGVCGKG